MKRKLLLFILILCSSVIYAQTSLWEPAKVVVKIKDGIKAENTSDLMKQSAETIGAKKVQKLFQPKHQNIYAQRLDRTYVIYTVSDDAVSDALNYYRSLEYIEYAERVPLIDLLFVPDDSLYKTSILGANPIWPLTNIHAETAWDYTHGSPLIKIAIVDNAVWTDHPDLKGKFVDTYDFADNDTNTAPYSFANDAYGRQWTHGTHVAGLAGAITNNNRGIASIGFNTSLMAYKMYSDGVIPFPNLTAGCTAIQEAADRGANIINISWGSTNQLSALQDAVDYANAAGVVVVAAAGNNGEEQAYYPAACSHVIAVTAVGMDNKLSSFSNYGTFVDLTSPGGYGPNDAGSWSPVSTTSHIAYAWNQIIGNVRYDGKVGTSMAAPIVSGLCGLLFALDSTLTPDEVETVLKSTAVDISSQNTAYTGKIGAGRIDAAAAVAAVASTTKIKITGAGDAIVSIYPNPATDRVNIFRNHHTIKKAEIWSITGCFIKSYDLSGSEGDIVTMSLDLANGMYLIKLYVNDVVITKKLSISASTTSDFK